MWIGWQNKFDASSLSSPAAASGLPVQNVQLNPAAFVWRTTATTTYALADAGSAVTWRLFFIAATNLTSAATYRIRLGSTSAVTDFDTGTLSAGIISGYNYFPVLLGADQTCQYARIDLTDTSLSFIDVGRIFGGPAWQPSIGSSFGARFGYLDLGISQKTPAGQIVTTKSAGRPRFEEFSLEYLSETEAIDNLLNIDRAAGTNADIAVLIDPDNRLIERSVYGPYIVTPITHQLSTSYAKQFQVEQRL